MTVTRVPWSAYWCLAASMTLVGSYVGLSRLLVAALPIFLLAWLRFGVAAVAMLAWLRPQPGEPALTPQAKRLLFWESFLGNFLFSICMLGGVAATSALAAGVTMAMIPAAVALLSRWWLREALPPRVVISVALAVVAIALLAWAQHAATSGHTQAAAASHPWWGYALLVAAVLCEASYVVIGKRLSAQVSPQRISALINLWGLVLITPLGVWQAWSFDFAAVSLDIWALLGFYAIAASVLTVSLWMRGLQQVPASQAGVFTVCLPMATAVIGVWGLGEAFSLMHAAAFGLSVAGLLIATWPPRAAR